jgi:hypothetical protein
LTPYLACFHRCYLFISLLPLLDHMSHICDITSALSPRDFACPSVGTFCESQPLHEIHLFDFDIMSIPQEPGIKQAPTYKISKAVGSYSCVHICRSTSVRAHSCTEYNCIHTYTKFSTFVPGTIVQLSLYKIIMPSNVGWRSFFDHSGRPTEVLGTAGDATGRPRGGGGSELDLRGRAPNDPYSIETQRRSEAYIVLCRLRFDVVSRCAWVWLCSRLVNILWRGSQHTCTFQSHKTTSLRLVLIPADS